MIKDKRIDKAIDVKNAAYEAVETARQHYLIVLKTALKTVDKRYELKAVEIAKKVYNDLLEKEALYRKAFIEFDKECKKKK